MVGGRGGWCGICEEELSKAANRFGLEWNRLDWIGLDWIGSEWNGLEWNERMKEFL